MAFLTDLLKQVFTTTATGAVALRAIISGDQNLGGGYISNDQTTTNMMSKGTVYRFDGVNDIVSMGTSSGIVDIFDNGGCVVSEIYPLSDGENNAGTIAQTRNSGGQGWNITLAAEAAGYVKITFVCEFSTTDGTWSTDVVLPLNTWSNVAVVYDSSSVANVPAIYFNGVPMTVGSVSTPDGTRVTDAGQVVSIGNRADTQTTFDGSIASVLFGNFAPTAAEVKDLISGNIPFKWQYGSQTSQVTGTDSDFSGAGNWTGSGGLVTFDVNSTEAGRMYQLLDSGVTGFASIVTKLTIGKEYGYSLSAENIAGTPTEWQIGSDISGTPSTNPAIDTFTPTASAATYTGTFIADGTTLFLGVTAASANGSSGAFDNILVYPLGAVALYDQTSISETTWYDKANGNDGAVTGASVLNRPSVTPLSCLRSARIKIEPGTTPGTNIKLTDVSTVNNSFNSPALIDAVDIVKGDTPASTSTSFGLSAGGTGIKIDLGYTPAGVLPHAIIIHDMNSSTATEIYFVDVAISSGLLELTPRISGSVTAIDWTTIMDLGDRMDILLSFITAT